MPPDPPPQLERFPGPGIADPLATALSVSRAQCDMTYTAGHPLHAAPPPAVSTWVLIGPLDADGPGQE